MPPIELGVICFGAFVLVMLVAVRAKRSHSQKIRRAASSGFYDFDVAHYGNAGSSLMEKSVEDSRRPLAPSFVASGRGGGGGGGKGNGSQGPKEAMPIPSSFGVIDRSPVGPLPAFDSRPGGNQRPIPSAPTARPAPASDPGNPPLPPLVQPPPPASDPHT